MRKILFIVTMLAICDGAFARAAVTNDGSSGTVSVTACGGRFYNKDLKRRRTKQDLLQYLTATNEYGTFLDSDGVPKNLMEPGITRKFWVQCFAKNFDATAGKELEESVFDPTTGNIDGNKVLAVIQASNEVQETWNAVPDPANPDRFLSSEVNSTYPCVDRNTYIPLPRLAYKDEFQLEYKTRLILSEHCGNPLQDFRPMKTENSSNGLANGSANSYQGTLPAGQPVIINVYGSQANNNLQNVGNPTTQSTAPASTTPIDQGRWVAYTGAAVAAPVYAQAASQQYVQQTQPQYVQPQGGYVMPYGAVKTKPNGVEIADLSVDGAHFLYDIFMDWIPGSPRNRVVTTNNTNCWWGNSGNGFVPNGSGKFPGQNNGNFAANGTGSFNNPFNTGNSGNGGFVWNGGN